MSMFSFFSRGPKQNKAKPRKSSQARPALEALEDRFLLACNIISGFVYQDANNNGIRDFGELPIANSSIELRDAANKLVGTDVTDINGYYEFNHDITIDQTLKTITQVLNIPTLDPNNPHGALTDFVLSGQINQFNPTLGELQSVTVTIDGSVTSEIKVENTSPVSTSSIKGTVAGSMQITGPGVDKTLNLSKSVDTPFAATMFDGIVDYAGTSGTTFGLQVVSGTALVTLVGAGMTPYKGTGQVTFTETAQASSFAAGGGNLDASITSWGKSQVTIKYNYIPNNCLKAGNYTIYQVTQPTGLNDGAESIGTTVLNNPPKTDFIPVVLASTDLTNNNFGELVPAGLSGFVYHDVNNNGIKESGELGIPGVRIDLAGPPGTGLTVVNPAITDADGFYQFLNLNAGTYTVTETQPTPGWLDGKDTGGSVLWTVTNDKIASIVIAPGGLSNNNNFGELKAASISGFVYVDPNNDGVRQTAPVPEAPIPGVTVTLSGIDDLGNVVSVPPAVTDGNGFYQFLNLRPGAYTVVETQPGNFLDGKDTTGTPPGGIASNDNLANLVLTSGFNGVNNNFGELVPASIAGFVYVDSDDDGVKDPNENGIPGASVLLTGFDDFGPVVRPAATTGGDGSYQFLNLRPGTYALVETQPINFNDGKDTIGTPGGLSVNDNFSTILLPAGFQGVNNNFGELVPENADLGIVKSASATSVLVGSNFSYTLTITNYGTFTAKVVKVEDFLPPDTAYVSASGAGWAISQANGKITATMPALAVGASAQIQVFVKAPGIVTSLTNVSTVTSNTPDSNPNNNTSTVIVTTFNTPGDVFAKAHNPLHVNIPIIGKVQLFTDSGPGDLNPVLRGQMAFADASYKTFLGRGATFNEIMTIVGQLQGGWAPATVAATLGNSDAHLAYKTQVFYQNYLNRAATPFEVGSAIQSFRAGATDVDLALSLLSSADYQTAHPTTSSLVNGLFKDILNKTPDMVTQLQIATVLSNQTTGSFAQTLLLSADGLGNLVDNVYRSVLRRPATALEVQTWVTKLQGNTGTLAQLEIQLLGSAEFYQLAFFSVV